MELSELEQSQSKHSQNASSQNASSQNASSQNASSQNASSKNASSKNASSKNEHPPVKIERRMNFRNVKMEVVVPLFFGLIGSLLLCAVVSADTAIFSRITPQ